MGLAERWAQMWAQMWVQWVLLMDESAQESGQSGQL
jgi:hypothetical protein